MVVSGMTEVMGFGDRWCLASAGGQGAHVELADRSCHNMVFFFLFCDSRLCGHDFANRLLCARNLWLVELGSLAARIATN